MSGVGAFIDKLRFKSIFVLAIVTVAAFMFLYPEQRGVVLGKVALVELGIVLGYLNFRVGYPREPEDSPVVLTYAKTAIIAVTVLALVIAV